MKQFLFNVFLAVLFWIPPLLIVASLRAEAPDAVLTVSEETSGAQTKRPFSISYVFAKGEIPDYPQPVIGGTPEVVFQSDIKTRWRDGTSSCSISAATNTEPIYITCAAHGYRTGESVLIAAVEGNTAANGRWKVYPFSYNQFVLIGSNANGDYTTGGTATGPGAGSVKHAIVSFTESFTADQAKTLTFRNSINPCSSGNQAACDAAGLDEAGMLAFTSSAWNGRIELEADEYDSVGVVAIDFTDARQMVDDANFEYWLRGPVVTMVIARDLSDPTTYGAGYNCEENCTTTHATATWTADAVYAPLNPTYELWFYAGWSGVRIDYILENTWATHMKPQVYDWVCTSDTSFSTTEDSGSAFLHYSGTRWRVTAWDGDVPGTMGIDRNREYLQYVGAFPNYPLVDITANDLAQLQTDLEAGDYSLGSNALWHLPLYDPGSNPNLGLLSHYYTIFFMGGFPVAAEPYILSLGDVSGYVPDRLHVRESVLDSYYWDADSDGTAAADADDNITDNGAFGRPISIHTRPTSHNGSPGWSWAADEVATGWDADKAHQPGFNHLPYLMTGDPYYLEEMYFWASWNAWSQSPVSNDLLGRHASWGLYAAPGQQERGYGWSIRNNASAAYWAPDGTVEKEYYTQLVDRQIAGTEGFVDTHGPTYLKVTNAPDSDPCPVGSGTNNGKSYNAYDSTSSDPAYSTPWCWGRGFMWNNPFSGTQTGNALGVPNFNRIAPDQAGMTTTNCYLNSNWMYAIAYYGIGMAWDLGFPAEGLMRGGSQYALVQSTHTGWNWKYVEGYRSPLFDLGEPGGCTLYSWLWQDWDSFYTGWGTYEKETWSTNYAGGFSYIHSWISALSFMTTFAHGPHRGWDAWDWFSNEANVPNSQTWATTGSGSDYDFNYLSAIKPRIEPVRPTVEPGDDFAIFRYTAPAADSSCTVAGGSDGLTGRTREYVLTGLTAETEYAAHAVVCADDPWGSTTLPAYTTLATLSGTGSFQITIGSGSTTAYIDWDTDGSAPWANTDSESCAAGCTVALTDPNKGLIYYRVRRDAGGDIVGSVHAAIVQ